VNDQQWDPDRLRVAIPKAREQVSIVARFVEIGPTLPDWGSHRPVVELLFYLCRLDYDIKVLLLQFLTDGDNRAVWEPLLALEVHEALETVPKAINRARLELGKPASRSGLNLQVFDEASKQYRTKVKIIRDDADFMKGLTIVRNGVAAHHGLNKGKGMDASIAWALSTWRLSTTELTTRNSQIGEYAVKLGLAIQDFATRVEEGNK
jgi:hypothetical protein